MTNDTYKLAFVRTPHHTHVSTSLRACAHAHTHTHTHTHAHVQTPSPLVKSQPMSTPQWYSFEKNFIPTHPFLTFTHTLPPPLLSNYDHTHLGKCPQRSHCQSSCQVCTYSRLSAPCLARVTRHNSKGISPQEGLAIPTEVLFTSRDETPGKDGAKTPSLGDREETTALLEHDDESYSLLCTHITQYYLYKMQ